MEKENPGKDLLSTPFMSPMRSASINQPPDKNYCCIWPAQSYLAVKPQWSTESKFHGQLERRYM